MDAPDRPAVFIDVWGCGLVEVGLDGVVVLSLTTVGPCCQIQPQQSVLDGALHQQQDVGIFCSNKIGDFGSEAFLEDTTTTSASLSIRPGPGVDNS